ncbi:hypothetical protein CROQUDRAFT_659250 [Cronartium quercuum f. sp. fusiforme G11]|uniref:Uncharacterized protein n=1 Tax=Cronartium quercuum f. sp. fusiforme G11 TaxID=708437 RepID=A0A9P6TA89_9BASI|nr:hypothetical protein CROQUDRAFT_659250 [Cronartium quercuum f. sp. fusiforme G11]
MRPTTTRLVHPNLLSSALLRALRHPNPSFITLSISTLNQLRVRSNSVLSDHHGPYSITALSGLPITTTPRDIHHTCQAFDSLPIAIYPVFQPHNWSSLTFLLFFASRTQNLPNLPLSSPSKSPATYHALRTLLPTAPNPNPSSGRAVVLDGIPTRLSHQHVTDSLLAFGFPILTHTEPRTWPGTAPVTDRPMLTRYQVIYLPSIALAYHLAGQLHRSRPAWLPHRKTSSPSGIEGETGWELKARVLY